MIERIVTNLRLITGPAVEPLSLAEARLHLRLDASGSPETHPDDALVTSLIKAVRQNIDGKAGWLNRALITQTWELVMDKFPSNEIRIPLPPLQSVTSIKYDDVDGVEQTVDSIDYIVDSDSEPGWIVPVSGVPWPATMDAISAVRVRFVAGYGGASGDVPEPIRSAILLMIANLYENRQSVGIASAVNEIPMAIDALLAPYRIWSFG